MSTGLRGTEGQILCTTTDIASKYKRAPLRKGMGAHAVQTWVCLGLNHACDIACVK